MTEQFSTCPFCNAKNRVGSKFCRGCGKKIQKDRIDLQALREQLIKCPVCKRSMKSSAKVCHCGTKLSPASVKDPRTSLLTRSATKKIDRLKRPELVLSKPVKEAISFLKDLRESYGMELDDLKSLVNCQQYLFDTSDKGLALIEENTGRFITINYKFEEIAGHSKSDLYGETLSTLIKKLNPQNKEYDIKAIVDLSEFSILNSKYEAISVKVTRNRGPFDNNSLVVIMDIHSTAEHKWFKKSRASTKKLNLVAKMAEEISRSLDIKVLLQNTLEKTMTVTNSDVAVIMFMDENKNLYPMASKGISKNLIEDLKNRTIKADKGSRARALLLGKTIEAKIKHSDSPFTGPLAVSEQLTSILTVPLKSKDDTLGIMSLGRRKAVKYSGPDFELLDTIVNHIVIAINNSRLYEQIKSQLQELEDKNKKLEELEQTKKSLTRAIVHDLKAPLTGIMGYAEFLLMNYDIEPVQLLKMYQRIYSGSQDILRMVVNLLDISKMEEDKVSLNLTSINPEKIIDNILDELQIKIAKKELEVIKTINETLPDIKADKDLFKRIVMNLLDNAIKYSKSKKTIEIKAEEEDENHITFSVIDEGTGIPEEYQEDIFKSFFSMAADNAAITPSTGIGLSFCKFAVEAHGGKIWMEENSPVGSKFIFTLPLKKD